MNIDLSRFKVIYDEKVLRAVALQSVIFVEDTDWEAIIKKPKILEILALNEDGEIISIRDEAWRFQFIPRSRYE